MVSAINSQLKLPPLSKKGMAQLITQAKRIGMIPAEYARQLVEDSLALQREAEETSFAQIMGPVRRAAGKVDDKEIVKLVEKARRAAELGKSGRRKR